MEARTEEATKPKERFQFPIGPARMDRIEGRKLFSVGETYPVRIPRFQAEILIERLKKGEIWHVTPWPRDIEKETGLVLSTFEHEPSLDDKLTEEKIEKFLVEFFPGKTSVKLEGSLTDIGSLKFHLSENGERMTLNIGDLAEHMNELWLKSQRMKALRPTREEKPERWKKYVSVPKGALIRTAPPTTEGVHAEVLETIKEITALPYVSRKKEPGGIVHYYLKGGGWVSMRYRGKEREIL